MRLGIGVARPFSKLRSRMLDYDVTQEDIARRLMLSRKSVSQRFAGHEEWKLGECYDVLSMLDVPDKRLSEYFPRGGRNE